MLSSEKGKPNYGEISPWPSGRNFYFREPNTRGVEFCDSELGDSCQNFVLSDACQCAKGRARRVIGNVLGTVPKYRFENVQLENVFMEKAQNTVFFGQYKIHGQFRYIGTI